MFLFNFSIVVTPKDKDVKDSKKVDPEEDERNSLSDINVYMTVFLLFVTATIPSIPSLLTWAHNYKYVVSKTFICMSDNKYFLIPELSNLFSQV